MQKSSFDPMKFGSQNDLKLALTELKMMEKSNGRINKSDFSAVSQKYMFPIDFLEKGLKGFSYPEDLLISKSKWFAILYSWIVKDEERSLNLFRLQFAYIRARYVATFAIVYSIAVSVCIDFILPFFFQIDPLQRLLGVILPFIFFYYSSGSRFWIIPK
jgi:hypothetical protein